LNFRDLHIELFLKPAALAEWNICRGSGIPSF
jgi:hypothetical protein